MSRPRLFMFTGLLVAGCLGTAIAAQAQTTDALRQAEEGTFKSADLNGDGKVSRREVVHFTDLVFLSMDTDENERVTVEEWMAWDTGYQQAAAKAGKEQGFRDAKRTLFNTFDLNKDGTVEHGEMSAVVLYQFYSADTDKNGSLNQTEFTTEFLIPKTLRAAAQ